MPVTLSANDFHFMLKTAALFACPDQTIPAVHVVRLEQHGAELVAVATDRFRIGAVRSASTYPARSLTGSADSFPPVSIPLKTVKQLVTMLKPATGRGAPEHAVRLVVSDDHKELSWSRSDGLSGTVELEQADFPKWRGLMMGHDYATTIQEDAEPCAVRVCVDPELLAPFTKAKRTARDNITVEAVAGKGKPIIIRVGTHFIGVLMPVRANDGGADSLETRHAWSAIIEDKN